MANVIEQEVLEYMVDLTFNHDFDTIVEAVDDGSLHQLIIDTLYNDSYIIGTYEAREWIKDNWDEIGEVIENQMENMVDGNEAFISPESFVDSIVIECAYNVETEFYDIVMEKVGMEVN
jgi:hypothetical protein